MSHYRVDRAGIYRARNGMVAGVCKSFADYFDISVFWTRVFTFTAFWFTGIFPTLFLYVLAALLMKKEPYYRWC